MDKIYAFLSPFKNTIFFSRKNTYIQYAEKIHIILNYIYFPEKYVHANLHLCAYLQNKYTYTS